MPISLFTFVGAFRRTLITADHLLKRGADHAQSQGLDPETILGWRLIDDMQPLGFQIMVVHDFASQWPPRAAGLPVPAGMAEGLDLAGLKAALALAGATLDALTPAQFEGRDDAAVTFAIGGTMEMTLPAGQWLSGFATTNLHFHLSTAYGILRSNGVPLGKPDLFAGGL